MSGASAPPIVPFLVACLGIAIFCIVALVDAKAAEIEAADAAREVVAGR